MPEVRYLRNEDAQRFNLKVFPAFMKEVSVKDIRRLYGRDCLLVRNGVYIYNVTSCPEIYAAAN